MTQTLILIPSRMASTRLPNKPMAMIGSKPMIIHVMERAMEADIGRPVVCTDDNEIFEVVKDHGGDVVMTKADHPSGSDRIWEAVEQLDPDAKAEYIVNVQGDLPSIEPQLIRASLTPLLETDCDISTLATLITEDSERENSNVVKVVGTPSGPNRLRAMYFTRATAPWSPPGEESPLYHHIGLYCYKREVLAKFVSLEPSPLEIREKLEQLRALENGMSIEVSLVETAPLGVDTPEDLEKARKMLS